LPGLATRFARARQSRRARHRGSPTEP